MKLSWKEFKRELVKIAKQYDLEVFEHVDRKNRPVRTIIFLDEFLEKTIAQVEIPRIDFSLGTDYDTRMLDGIKQRIELSLNRQKRGIDIRDVKYSCDKTIVKWTDGTKTVVTLQDGDLYDSEKGLSMAIAKKHFGNTSAYYDNIKKWLPKEKSKKIKKSCAKCRYKHCRASDYPCQLCTGYSKFVEK